MKNSSKIDKNENENIQFNFDESYETYDEHSIDLLELINNFENIKINDFDLDLESITASQIINYQINYTVKQLILICDYYGISKEIKVTKCNKHDIFLMSLTLNILKNSIYQIFKASYCTLC